MLQPGVPNTYRAIEIRAHIPSTALKQRYYYLACAIKLKLKRTPSIHPKCGHDDENDADPRVDHILRHVMYQHSMCASSPFPSTNLYILNILRYSLSTVADSEFRHRRCAIDLPVWIPKYKETFFLLTPGAREVLKVWHCSRACATNWIKEFVTGGSGEKVISSWFR